MLMHVLALAATVIPGLAMATHAGGDEAAVRSVLDSYVAGENGDVERLKQAFHPNGHLYFISPKDGAFTVMARDAYIGFVENVGKLNPKTMRVVSVAINGTAATATVELCGSNPAVTITDFLGLLRVADGWIITSRVSSIVADAH